METEIWKDVPGYESYYQCSNFGRIKSLKRLSVGRAGFMRTVNEKILKPSMSSSRYLKVDLSKNKITKTISIHKIVAITFLNHTQGGYMIVVNHIDGNHINNNVNNLEIVSQRENSSVCFRKLAKPKSSIYIGVSLRKNRNMWISQIQINNKVKYLGMYDSELKASESYNNALLNIKK